MRGQLRILTIAITLIAFDCAKGENLWCYECNTNLKDGHNRECNDPYSPGPSLDLVSCPRNESHHCLKSVVFYRNVLVTVRACVPSREIDGYCRHEEHFPDSSIECFFCKDYACNGQESFKLSTPWNLRLFMVIPFFVSNLLTLYP